MVWTRLTEGLAEALRRTGLWSEEREGRIELAIPRDPSHGDWTTNLAMLIAKDAGRPPRALAEALAAAFPESDEVEPPTVAGPGFLNFRYRPAFVQSLPGTIVAADAGFGSHDHARGHTVLVEYVSANPTGPLNVVSARAAAVGACLVRLLEATGHRAQGVFYVNDAGRQVNLLGESLAARFAERIGVPVPFPEDGYQGGYLRELAAQVEEGEARRALDDDDLVWFRGQALERMLAWQKKDLAEYGAEFARWYRESELHDSGAVDEALQALTQRGMIYQATKPETDRTAEGAATDDHADDDEPASGEATFLRTAKFGDDKDRVVKKSDGAPTYLLPDIAYHRDKHERGFEKAIDLWGPDHHGYIPRMKAALQALGLPPDFLEVLIVQQVNLKSGGQPVKMSKRAGEFITLRDLMDEVGSDCAKFFFLMRSTNAHLDFDMDLAKRQNDENPAYYVQYAHARIASVIRFAAEKGARAAAAGVAGAALEQPEEIQLIRKLAAFPEVVRGAAFAREPHRVPVYLHETAAEFHRFYHACRVVTDDAALSAARLRLCEAARIVIRNGLTLLGVSAPERMERAVEAVS